MKNIRLYGRGFGYGSHARVTAGFRRVLEKEGRLAGFCDFDLLDPSKEGSSAPIAIFTGPLSLMHRMKLNALHEQRWVMVAPNSTEIGVQLEKELPKFATHLIAPSQWAADVLRTKVELPVITMQHGVEPEFCLKEPFPMLEDRDQFTVLHLSSSDRQRKGTAELVEAWQEAKPLLPRYATLVLVVENQSLLVWKRKIHPEMGITVRPRFGPMGEGLPPEQMAELYRRVHAVAQPSRGEAFGLVPLEARCCGTPVIVTKCTGHSEHLHSELPGVVAVPTGGLCPIDDLPGAEAPQLNKFNLADSLREASRRWIELRDAARANAPHALEAWSWERVLEGRLP